MSRLSEMNNHVFTHVAKQNNLIAAANAGIMLTDTMDWRKLRPYFFAFAYCKSLIYQYTVLQVYTIII